MKPPPKLGSLYSTLVALQNHINREVAAAGPTRLDETVSIRFSLNQLAATCYGLGMATQMAKPEPKPKPAKAPRAAKRKKKRR